MVNVSCKIQLGKNTQSDYFNTFLSKVFGVILINTFWFEKNLEDSLK